MGQVVPAYSVYCNIYICVALVLIVEIYKSTQLVHLHFLSRICNCVCKSSLLLDNNDIDNNVQAHNLVDFL